MDWTLSSLKWSISYLLSQCRKAYSYGRNFLDGPITVFSLQCNLKVVGFLSLWGFLLKWLWIFVISIHHRAQVQLGLQYLFLESPSLSFSNYHQYTLVCVHSINIFNLVYHVLWAQESTNHIVLTWDYFSGLHDSICENKYLKTIRYKKKGVSPNG